MTTHAEMAKEAVKNLDLKEYGAEKDGQPQVSEKRQYVQLQAFQGKYDQSKIIESLSKLSFPTVLYHDVNDPYGIAILSITDEPDLITSELRDFYQSPLFSDLHHQKELTLIGRTYALGHEADLEDVLFKKTPRNALNPDNKWAVWYPLRRKPEFEVLPKKEQGKMLLEHGMIGIAYGRKGYANDIRLACHGLDKNDNEFVIGLVSSELYPLSKLVQHMRKTEQTSQYIQSLGPFFVGKVAWQAPLTD